VRPPGRLPGIRRVAPFLRRVEPKTVLFDSWRGKYADSPRAIAEELHRRDPSFRQVWVLEQDDPLLPEWVDAVRPHSRHHVEYLGCAQYVVTNSGMPGYWRKRRQQAYLQTWHGTPLKKLGRDIQRPAMPKARRYMRDFSRDVSYWDLLLSQNPFSTGVLRQAFQYKGPILEAGYPRNDVLLSPHADRVRAATRHRLGLDEEARALLYAPTWRDNTRFELQLDLESIANDLGPRDVFLLRAHNHVARTVAETSHPRVIDVSRIPDTPELLLAADVLITDYSSVMFDFANTGRPMVFFAYDYDDYVHSERGVYFELAERAPGPLVRTGDELIQALASVDSWRGDYEERYRTFIEEFGEYDRGDAARRIVDHVFFGKPHDD
jgi:CDP-glycerol glycerophosphotransferase